MRLSILILPLYVENSTGYQFEGVQILRYFILHFEILQGLAPSYLKKLISMMPASHYQLGYLKDCNDAAHFVDTDMECHVGK